MSEWRSKANVVLRVVVEPPDRWNADCQVDQIRRQAAQSAAGAVRAHLGGGRTYGRVKFDLLGTPEVQVIVFHEDREPEAPVVEPMPPEPQVVWLVGEQHAEQPDRGFVRVIGLYASDGEARARYDRECGGAIHPNRLVLQPFHVNAQAENGGAP